MTLTRRSAIDLVTAMANGELGVAELMRATIERIDEINGSVNAIVGLRDGDDLMAQARDMDSGPKRGPLHGLPIAVKDLVNVAGVLSTQGSPMFADFVPDTDDLIAARMREAGAILIGKTNTPEFGFGSHTFNTVYGATRNPYDLSLSCGGSSGGAAVTLATGMTALADGSDEMGSLRNPAAWNNVYGFRPSFGRVPLDPERDLFLHQLATLGPMARSPEDIALLLDVIAGADPRLPLSLDGQATAPVHPADMSGKRIGWLGDWDGAYAMAPGILDICESALKVFEDLGATVDHVPAPHDAGAIWEAWIDLRSWGKAAGLSELMAQDRNALKDTVIWEIERGLALSAMDVHRASVKRSDWFRRTVDLFNTYDALVLPSAQVWPFEIETPYPTEIAGQTMDTYHRWMEVTIPIGLIGLPGLAVPVGFGAQGLPMGMQLFGPRGSDSELLSLGAAYHAATQWPEKRPA